MPRNRIILNKTIEISIEDGAIITNEINGDVSIDANSIYIRGIVGGDKDECLRCSSPITLDLREIRISREPIKMDFLYEVLCEKCLYEYEVGYSKQVPVNIHDK